MEVLPTLTIHLTSSNYVVYTYAAVCIERILGMKDKQTQMFHQNDVAEVAFGLCQKLFELIWKGGSQPHKLAENDFLMKGKKSNNSMLFKKYFVIKATISSHTHIFFLCIF